MYTVEDHFGEMVFLVENGIGDSISNPGLSSLHFTSHL